MSDPGEETPVSALIKATVQDAPYLATMVPHMLRQARFPFAERLLVVDRPARFAGKYRRRATPARAALDAALAGLLEAGEVDRVLEVDYRPAVVRRVMGRYFGGDARNAPTHAGTGGPVYATLFGLEAVQHDLVVQYDADMLFCARGGSWLRVALERMAQDGSLWAMMTHAGPPAGPLGHRSSLGPRNASRASWDRRLGVWRFRTLSTRYFLCDRRRFRGALAAPRTAAPCPPLERLMSHALQRHDAWRGTVAMADSWDLHVHSHAPPFPDWAPRIVAAVEAGKYPQMQAGCYDLNLDRPAARQAWGALLEAGRRAAKPRTSRKPTPKKPEPPPAPEPPAPSAAGSRQSVAATAPLAVVLPVRNRSGARVRRALASLAWQEAGAPREILVVSYGSTVAENRRLGDDCARFGARLIAFGDRQKPWCKPLALNVGLKATSPDVPYVMTMDVDMILAPDFLEVVLGILKAEPPSFVLCESRDLPRGVVLATDPERLQRQFRQLRERARRRGRHGTGGVQAARREFFFRVRGYDEDLVWWGAEDGDMVHRAIESGLEVVWADAWTAMLHQWHPRRHQALRSPSVRAAAQQAWRRNHQLVAQRRGAIERNPRGWGHRSAGGPP